LRQFEDISNDKDKKVNCILIGKGGKKREGRILIGKDGFE